jgi:AraC-like DNA-binding protein
LDVLRNVDTVATVLPSTSAVLGLQLQGRVDAEQGLLTPLGVTGIQERARRYSYLGDTVSILVRFTPQGIASLGVPASELRGISVSLDEILPAARVRALREEIHAAPSQPIQIDRLQRFLAALPFEEDRLITRAVAALDGGEGQPPLRVRDLAKEVGLSERQLERRFLSRVGIGPRRYASLRRFERAVALAPGAPSLAHVAYRAGYADQSHFVREVRRLTGSTPGELLRGR